MRTRFKLSVFWIFLMLLVSVVGLFSSNDILNVNLGLRLSSPSLDFLFGTDELGRSLLYRIIKSTGNSILIGLTATFLNILIGLIFGLLGISYGAIVEKSTNFLIDLLWTIPYFVFAILALSIVNINVITVIIILSITNWVGIARVIKEEAYKAKEKNWMTAAKSAGLGNIKVLLYHLVPYLKPHILSYAAFVSIEVFTLEAGLSYLGLSVPPPFPTWGGMIAQGLPYFESGIWLVIVPAFFLFMTILSLYQISIYFKSFKN